MKRPLNIFKRTRRGPLIDEASREMAERLVEKGWSGAALRGHYFNWATGGISNKTPETEEDWRELIPQTDAAQEAFTRYVASGRGYTVSANRVLLRALIEMGLLSRLKILKR